MDWLGKYFEIKKEGDWFDLIVDFADEKLWLRRFEEILGKFSHLLMEISSSNRKNDDFWLTKPWNQ